MNIYTVKASKFSGTSYSEIERQARKLHNTIAKQTKRNAYIRSTYFKKNKIFIKLFWEHLNQKPRKDRKRRLKYYACAIELLRHTPHTPETRQNPNGRNELVHRFAGITKEGEEFYVQVKENKANDDKYLISVFPPK